MAEQDEFRIKAGGDLFAGSPQKIKPVADKAGAERFHAALAGLSDAAQRNAEINLETAQETRQAIANVHQRLDQLTQIARSLRNTNGGGG